MLRRFRSAGVVRCAVGGARPVGLRQQGRHDCSALGRRARRPAASRTSSSTSATASSSRSDSTELTAQSRATLDKQAQWLQQYGNYAFTIEGHADERGTREYNIALGARRAQAVRDYLASRGIQPSRMRTDLLRQGAPGRGVQRHLVLVAEPPRCDGSRRHLLRPVRREADSRRPSKGAPACV